MNNKIIFFDIDGTLLDEKTGLISQSTKEALQQAKQNNHILIINTGRPIASIDSKIKELNFDGYICGCGTYIEYHNEPILHVTLDETIRLELIRQAYLCRVQAVLEGKNGIYFPKNITHPFILNTKDNYIKEGFQVFEYDIDDFVDFDKLAVWYDDNSDIETFRCFLKKYFEIIQRDDDFIEVVPLGYSKATGIRYLIDYLNIDYNHTISIGDSTNDLSMLEYTKESIAMGNSHPLVFDKVTYITDHIEENGIYNALKHFQII